MTCSLSPPGKSISTRGCLEQIGLWACLGGFLIPVGKRGKSGGAQLPSLGPVSRALGVHAHPSICSGAWLSHDQLPEVPASLTPHNNELEPRTVTRNKPLFPPSGFFVCMFYHSDRSEAGTGTYPICQDPFSKQHHGPGPDGHRRLQFKDCTRCTSSLTLALLLAVWQ